MTTDKSLSDIEEILKNHPDLKGYFGETAKLFVYPTTLLLLLTTTDPVTAFATFSSGATLLSFNFKKLADWLPDKLNYLGKGKELAVKERYEKLALANHIALHIAIREGVKNILTPYVEQFEKKSQPFNKINFDSSALAQLLSYRKNDKKPKNLIIKLKDDSQISVKEIIHSTCLPIVSELAKKLATNENLKEFINTILVKLIKDILKNYNAYLIHLSKEFPEFAQWVSITDNKSILQGQNEILKQLEKSEIKNTEKIEVQKDFIKTIETTFTKIQNLKNYEFEESFGFKTLLDNQIFLSRKIGDISELYEKDKRKHIKAHHSQIKSKLTEKLLDNEDIEGIVYPKTEEIFIPQSFKTITYNKTEHKKRILLDSFWEPEDIKINEDIGKFLCNELYSPENSLKPIIILGNPGAGKSMLSNVLAARLCDSHDFVPFFVRLRDVVLTDNNPITHINQTLSSFTDVDWISWIGEFKSRIPVIILDGFDELLRASKAEINNYVKSIKDLLAELYRDYSISARIILTSRLTVMQDVDIPNDTTIIKLNPFDSKRQQLWIEQWNKSQLKNGFTPFKLPDNPSVQELAQEPLLLFMLAVYDFEDADLQKETLEQDFNQSKLYDKLFEKFTQRQLVKELDFKDKSDPEKAKISKKFRLRLGAIATLMFLNDVDYKETQKLASELDTFGIGGDDAKPSLIFKGFFFIHKNQATDLSENKLYTFEFIHKSFGEFLAADFLLSVFKEEFVDDEIEELSQEDTYRFCWGFNWLHKHYNTTRFLFEYTSQFFTDPFILKSCINKIKKELKAVLGTNISLFPTSSITLINNKPVLEHLGIYSQNLILLWVAINKSKPFPFDLYGISETDKEAENQTHKFESQDRTETDKNKQFWKKITKLWELCGNKNTTAKLKEWVYVEEKENKILLSHRKSKLTHNFRDSAKIACNDYEVLISDSTSSLKDLIAIIDKKPEFKDSAIKIINDKFDVFFRGDEKLLLDFSIDLIENNNINSFQKIRLFENLSRFFHKDYVLSLIDKIFIKEVIDSTGNLNKYLYGALASKGFYFDTIIRYSKNWGIDRFLNTFKLLWESKIISTSHKFILSRIDDKITEWSDFHILRYLYYISELTKSYSNEISVEDLEKISQVFINCFESKIENKEKSDSLNDFINKYLQYFIICKLHIVKSHPSTHTNNDKIFPNRIIIQCLDKFSLKDFDSSFAIEILYLHLISLKSNAINIGTIEKKYQNFIKKFNNSSAHKFVDLIGQLSTFYDLNDSGFINLFNDLLKALLLLYKNDHNYFHDYLINTKILYLATINKHQIENSVILDNFLKMFQNSDGLKKLTPRLRLQFAILLQNNDENLEFSHWDKVKEIIGEENTKLLDAKIDLSGPFATALFAEYQNHFYYELEGVDHIPYVFLKRSFLHKGKFDGDLAY